MQTVIARFNFLRTLIEIIRNPLLAYPLLARFCKPCPALQKRKTVDFALLDKTQNKALRQRRNIQDWLAQITCLFLAQDVI